MKTGTRRYAAATLTVGIPHGLPDRMQGRVREILSVFVPESHRRQGMASELLSRTIAEAGRDATVLMLSLDHPSLEAFYARLGFHSIQPLLMVHP